MKLYTNQLYYLLEKHDGNWDYTISNNGLLLYSIFGCLQLDQHEQNKIIDLLMQSKEGIITFKLGNQEYGIAYSESNLTIPRDPIGTVCIDRNEDRIIFEDLKKETKNKDNIANKFIRREK